MQLLHMFSNLDMTDGGFSAKNAFAMLMPRGVKRHIARPRRDQLRGLPGVRLAAAKRARSPDMFGDFQLPFDKPIHHSDMGILWGMVAELLICDLRVSSLFSVIQRSRQLSRMQDPSGCSSHALKSRQAHEQWSASQNCEPIKRT